MTENMHFINVIIVAGMSQGVFFTILLLRNRKNRYANRFMAMVGAIVTLLIGIPLMSQTPLFRHLPIFFFYLVCSPLMIAPLIYLYTKFLISPGLRFRLKDGSHFLLFLLWFLFLSIWYAARSANIMDFFKNDTVFLDAIMWINIVQSLTYHVTIFLILVQYSKTIKESLSSVEKISLKWLRTMIILGILFGFIMFTVMTLDTLLGFPKFDAGLWIILAMVVMMFVISYLATRQPEIFQMAVEGRGFRKKYQTSGLSPEKAKQLKAKLLNLMEREKPFLNSLLNINDLAKTLSVPPWYISQVINEGFGQNYFDFINKYRVEEARKHFSDPRKSHLSILDIAYEVGFNSKSTFNTAFKKYLKITPSHFRKKTLQQSA